MASVERICPIAFHLLSGNVTPLAFPRNLGQFHLCVVSSNVHGEAASRFPHASRGHLKAMKLDAKAIARLALPAGKTDAIYFDRDMPGFGLRLRDSGNGV